MELTRELAQHVAKIALEAGKLILQIRAEGYIHEMKRDNTPVTPADKAANELIVRQLQTLDPAIPIVSEESDYLPDAASLPERFWLVDPLDGTKGFINGGKNFTVNIALVEHKKPVFGVIYAPVLEEMYAGSKAFGAYRVKEGKEKAIQLRPLPAHPATLISSHHSDNEKQVIENTFPGSKLEPLSSSIKFCRVAEGAADLYLRCKPTSEWDTAAGQAILEAAGGKMLTYPEGKAFLYTKPEYENGGVIAGNAEMVDAVIAGQSKARPVLRNV